MGLLDRLMPRANVFPSKETMHFRFKIVDNAVFELRFDKQVPKTKMIGFLNLLKKKFKHTPIGKIESFEEIEKQEFELPPHLHNIVQGQLTKSIRNVEKQVKADKETFKITKANITKIGFRKINRETFEITILVKGFYVD